MSNTNSPLQPPAPFPDFEFTFDPAMSNVFPNPPPLPSSADLFSPSETTDLLGFLDGFNWDIENDDASSAYPNHRLPNPPAPYTNPHLHTSPNPSAAGVRISSRSASSNLSRLGPIDDQHKLGSAQSAVSDTSSTSSNTAGPSHQRSTSASSAAARAKPLLSTPQKRLNHIMSEQKRRNAIRDGYAQLIALLSPAGSAHGIGMPTRGRPKGSGSRGKGRSKGKSGVLFRAVEYCRFLEEGRDALREEVRRVEAAAGINQQ